MANPRPSSSHAPQEGQVLSSSDHDMSDLEPYNAQTSGSRSTANVPGINLVKSESERSGGHSASRDSTGSTRQASISKSTARQVAAPQSKSQSRRYQRGHARSSRSASRRRLSNPSPATPPGSLSRPLPRQANLPPALPQKRTLDQVFTFWESYNKKADFEDREFVKTLGATLDVLLIFAGLFSGVNTAFIIESLKSLQFDNAEETNRLLTLILEDGSNQGGSHPASVPTAHAIRTTSIFMASLCCSLSAAFGAVLGKQWLNNYEREGGIKTAPSRARERQRKYQGRHRWHLEGVIETLPTILQVSLYLFLLALVDFLHAMSKTVAWVVTGFAIIPVAFHLLTTAIAVIDSSSPFQTRLSTLMRSLRRSPRAQELWREAWLSIVRRSRVLRYAEFWYEPVKYSPRTLASRVSQSATDKLERFRSFWITIPKRISAKLFHRNAASTQARPPKTRDDEVLNLGCLIFSAKRATAADDNAALLEALAAISVESCVDRNDQIVTSLAETLFNFVLKPSLNPSGTIIWGIPSVDLSRLLKVLYLLFDRWDYLQGRELPLITNDLPSNLSESTYALRFFDALKMGLWEEFARNPVDNESVELIAGIMLHIPGYYECAQSQLSLLLEVFASQTSHPRVLLPYISLLFTQVYSAARSSRTRRLLVASKGVSDALVTTMWEGGQPDLDYYRGKLRIEWLPTLPAEPAVQESFNRYLLLWVKKHVTFKGADGASSGDGTNRGTTGLLAYLKSLCAFLTESDYHTENLWTGRQPDGNDHPTYLMRIIEGKSDGSRVGDFGPYSRYVGRATAMCCWLVLWHLHWQTSSVDQRSQDMQSSVNSILRLVTDENTVFSYDALDPLVRENRHLVELVLRSLVSFLEEAHRRGLIVQSGDTIIAAFDLWCQNVFPVDWLVRSEVSARVSRIFEARQDVPQYYTVRNEELPDV